MWFSPLLKYRIPLNLSSWITFVISLTFYWITADPEVSYWDCPEYVTVASRMEIGHPPGNPLWMLVMRVATIPFPNETHAYVINLCSGVFMAFAAFFLCRLIFVPVILCLIKFIKVKNLRYSEKNFAIISSFIAVGSALCFALCDSAWFSALEAEVYAMSVFLSSLSLWIMMLWWFEISRTKRIRLLILLAYLTGLSLGVHQLNLLLIPVFTLIIIYKRYPNRLNPFLVFWWIVISCGLIGFILMILLPGVLYGAQSFELFNVNTLGLPYHSGIIVFCSLTLGLFVICILLANRFSLSKVNSRHLSVLKRSLFPTTLWMLLFLLIGYSSYAIILIRANARPFMNEGVPDNIFSLTSYIARDQYPSPPLIYGETPYSRPMFVEEIVEGSPRYSRYILEKEKINYLPIQKGARLNHRSGLLSHEDSVKNERIISDNHGYVISDYSFRQKLTPELDMWFPRITSHKLGDRTAYEDWGGSSEKTMDKIAISETIDSTGKYQPRMDKWGNRHTVYSFRPTYGQNFQYFLSYQAYYMYFRYLLWNFVGRQNDFHSNGEIEHGNFITGISKIDDAIIGNTSYYPSELWEKNKGRNRYFGIPFIIGIIGLIWLLLGNRSQRRILTLITLIFLMTGLAIVVYLNQLPGEPRERDYTFLGSYMAFVMWIGAGLLVLSECILRYLPKKLAFVFIGLVNLGPSTLMALENFDDHDRRGRYQPMFFASSLLDFELPAVIFSHGDNSTFPLWHASEVLNYGPNHSIVDVTYLSLPSYVINQKSQGKKGIETSLSSQDMAYGAFVFSRIPEDSLSIPMDINKALEMVYDSDETIPEWPSSLIKLKLSENDSIIINLHDFTRGSSYLPFKNLMLLDILASQSKSDNPKILYFPALIDHSFYKALDPVLRPSLFGKIYAPWLNETEVTNLLRKSVERELKKGKGKMENTRYMDPVIADRTKRYRGELVIAANDLINHKDTATAIKIIKHIEQNYPYQVLLPGDFTISDSTFYEGKEYVKLLKNLYNKTEDPYFLKMAENIDTLMLERHDEWIKFYKHLNSSQRKTLSSRSKRLLIK